MLKRFWLLTLILGTLLLSACESGTGEIHGTIVDESRNIATQKFTVVLIPCDHDLAKNESFEAKYNYYLLSDENDERRQEINLEKGDYAEEIEFTFNDVPAGYYFILVENLSFSIVHYGEVFEVKPGGIVEQTFTVE